MPELAELIRQRNFNGLKEILCSFPAPDIAEIFVDLKPDDEAVFKNPARIDGMPASMAFSVRSGLSPSSPLILCTTSEVK